MDTVSDLWKKKYYTADINYLSSCFIREYDISKADISIFLSKGIISQEEYNLCYNLPSLNRNIRMGILQASNTSYKNILKEGIEEIRRKFFEANDIKEWEVLSIKNDAIFLINKLADTTIFDSIQLKLKNTYTSFYKLPKKYNKEFYYLLDRAHNIEVLDIKGINDSDRLLHEDYMIEFLKVLFCSIEMHSDLDDAIELIQTFYMSYINKELDLEYYRRFDQTSSFDLIIKSPILSNHYNAKYLSKNDMDIIDIGYNANFIMELYKIVSTMYFNKTKNKPG